MSYPFYVRIKTRTGMEESTLSWLFNITPLAFDVYLRASAVLIVRNLELFNHARRQTTNINITQRRIIIIFRGCLCLPLPLGLYGTFMRPIGGRSRASFLCGEWPTSEALAWPTWEGRLRPAGRAHNGGSGGCQPTPRREGPLIRSDDALNRIHLSDIIAINRRM